MVDRNQGSRILFEQLRNSLGRVIVNRFNETYKKHKIDYDPDTCYEAADDILVIIIAAAIDAIGEKEIK